MLRVVTTNNTEVFRHLGARALQSLGVDHHVGVDYDSTLELVKAERPQVAILDVALPGRDGYALCRAIKSDPLTADVCVVLVLTSILTREQLDKLEECGCDDVLALPIESDDFHQHIVRAAGLPYRLHDRVAVDVQVEIDRGVEQARMLDQLSATASDDPLPEPITGRCKDLSITGAGVELSAPLRAREQVVVTLRQGVVSFPPILATVAWTRVGGGKERAGLTFADVPDEARMLIEQMCLFDVTSAEGGGVVVRLRGDFTEQADFGPLVKLLESEAEIEIHTREVRYISSVGVRHWCKVMRALQGKKVRFRQLSLAFATQISMVPMAGGDAEILSFEAPYFCDSCDREEIRLLERGALLQENGSITPPMLSCSRCKGELSFDDLPERFFSFLSANPATQAPPT